MTNFVEGCDRHVLLLPERASRVKHLDEATEVQLSPLLDDARALGRGRGEPGAGPLRPCVLQDQTHLTSEKGMLERQTGALEVILPVNPPLGCGDELGIAGLD